jgi:cell shape-determining protein MreC
MGPEQDPRHAQASTRNKPPEPPVSPRSNTLLDRLKILATLVVIATFLFLLPARLTAPARVVFTEAVGPLQTAGYQAAGEALATSGTLTDAFLAEDRSRGLANEVERLHNENRRLQLQLDDATEALETAPKFSRTILPIRGLRAPVSGYGTSAVSRSVVVRAGSTHGVERGMAATSNGALVGTVTECGPWHSRIRLVTDPDSVVPCWVIRVGARGEPLGRSLWLLHGTGGPELRLEMIDHEALVREGDPVVTADLTTETDIELQFPPYVPVARITQVGADPMRPLFLDATVEPRANLDRLEHVEILIPDTPTADAD